MQSPHLVRGFLFSALVAVAAYGCSSDDDAGDDDPIADGGSTSSSSSSGAPLADARSDAPVGDASDASDGSVAIVVPAGATIRLDARTRSYPPLSTACSGQEQTFVLTPAGHLTTTTCSVEAGDGGDAGAAAFATTESDPSAADIEKIHAAIESLEIRETPVSDYPLYDLAVTSPDTTTQHYCAEVKCTDGMGIAVRFETMQAVDNAFRHADSPDASTP